MTKLKLKVLQRILRFNFLGSFLIFINIVFQTLILKEILEKENNVLLGAGNIILIILTIYIIFITILQFIGMLTRGVAMERFYVYPTLIFYWAGVFLFNPLDIHSFLVRIMFLNLTFIHYIQLKRIKKGEVS